MISVEGPDPGRPARVRLAWFLVALTAGSVAFRLLVATGLNHTSLVFIGIPAVLALVVALAPPPASAKGMAVKVTALALLISGIVLGEAFICILMAAPLFLLVALAIGEVADRMKKKPGRGFNSKAAWWIAVVLMPISLEGVAPGFEFERQESVTAVRILEATAGEVEQALARTPRFDAQLPAFFRLGFPTPGAVSGEGLAIGSRRAIEFRHGHHPGTLLLDVRASESGHVEFAATNDDSYLTHWLSWQRADVYWVELAPRQTLVRWTLHYRRRLDPSWYFGPLERYGVRLAAGYLIEALASPQPAGASALARPHTSILPDLFCRRW